MTIKPIRRQLNKGRYKTAIDISNLVQAYIVSKLPPYDFIKGKGIALDKFKEILEQYGVRYTDERLELDEIKNIIKTYTEYISARDQKTYLRKLGITPYVFNRWRKNFLIFKNSNKDIKVILVNENWEVAQEAKKRGEL